MSDYYRDRDARLEAGDLEWRRDTRAGDSDRPYGDRAFTEGRVFEGPRPEASTRPRHRGYRLGPYGHGRDYGPPDYLETGGGYGPGLHDEARYDRGYGEDRVSARSGGGYASRESRGSAGGYGGRYDDGRGFQGDNDRLQRVSDGSADHGHLFGGGTDSHRGRGPKGYSRSDSRINDDVADHLAADHTLDAREIEVAVKDGEVTLSGHVLRREDRRRAEDLAENVLGVKHVQNNLRVQSAGDGRPAPAAGMR